jgi:predicted DsbA family dithiol-disulfide isomerase
MAPEGKDRKTAIAEKFGSLENAKKIYERVSAAGQEVGVDFNFDAIPRTPNTQNSHRLIHWAGQLGKQNEVVEILFRSFFIDGKDIGAKHVLLDAAEEAGLDRKLIDDRLDTDLDLQLVLSEDVQARQLGVSGVPFFIFDRKYAFSGAQPPEAFLQVFDKIAEDAEQETTA